MWRYHEFLPVVHSANIVTLGEGGTPLLKADRLGKAFGFSELYIKDEGGNSTGSFKARGMSAAISKAKELGITKVAIPTAGNAGVALAAYGAKAGIEGFQDSYRLPGIHWQKERSTQQSWRYDPACGHYSALGICSRAYRQGNDKIWRRHCRGYHRQ